ncbi:MAG TPA: hypothetical protein VGG46_04125 [Terriglobales bacterium]|jgi:hypothetical protein
MNRLKKYWPTIVHIGGVAILFLAPSVDAFAKAHPVYAVPIAALWGLLLQRAKPPAQK